ncbi:MAG: MTH1187 family thiamine-binding protein [Methanomicrobiaceae archaeon]|nr:MTH1187 family thiamine-binding protein [Methanomicrobiaceae archaeon]
MIIAEFSITPIGTETTSVGTYVQAALAELEQQGGIRAKPEAMGTVIEAENLGDLFRAVEKAHNALFDLGIQRVVTELKIDDRRDKEATIESKTEALR